VPRGVLRARVLRRCPALLQGEARHDESRRDASGCSLRGDRMKRLAVMSFAATPGACTLAPRYQQPAAPVQASYEAVRDDASAAPASDIGWKEFFPDAGLQSLIARALENNRDLRIATLNV